MALHNKFDTSTVAKSLFISTWKSLSSFTVIFNSLKAIKSLRSSIIVAVSAWNDMLSACLYWWFSMRVSISSDLFKWVIRISDCLTSLSWTNCFSVSEGSSVNSSNLLRVIAKGVCNSCEAFSINTFCSSNTTSLRCHICWILSCNTLNSITSVTMGCSLVLFPTSYWRIAVSIPLKGFHILLITNRLTRYIESTNTTYNTPSAMAKLNSKSSFSTVEVRISSV